jgi:hypothetical protein
MREQIKRIAQTFAPKLFHWYRSYRLRQHFSARFKCDQRLFKQAFYPGNQAPKILTGPFQGMLYLDETVWGPIMPKWAGSYEMELQDIIARIGQLGYDQIVNIGCAEGYYAVGLALLDRRCEVLAFDPDPFARGQLRRLAGLNLVSDRIRIFSQCTHFRLSRLLKGKTLVFCDIEGQECVLLDPARVSGLRSADLLIEVHEKTAGPEKAERRLAERFTDTHTIERRVSRDTERWMDENQGLWQGKVGREQMLRFLDGHVRVRRSGFGRKQTSLHRSQISKDLRAVQARWSYVRIDMDHLTIRLYSRHSRRT